ncbi:hypothetical protein TC41_0136 [Alicyclobacillus acidocaldarius subsp. acidocaldarius Tc-4-1]|uniref:Uncharacterized protein n=1 Tax=Alicyclobacillus acidocaldarius (strain Tc-4-1) TaxID=1048834 RepID=F8IIF5_ALIAT|nr:hypothetical protein TC41_0136 [Alicyclobacillus acidocaldarius subsp. acidocaldarius Tc-4-1]
MRFTVQQQQQQESWQVTILLLHHGYHFPLLYQCGRRQIGAFSTFTV